MSDRELMRDKVWRELSTRISPDMVSGFDVGGMSEFSKKQLRLVALPREFRIHKQFDNYDVITTATALGIYGELDRAVGGLLPLREVPIWDFNVPDYGSTLYAVHGVYYLAQRTGRDDLLEELAPLRNVPEFYAPKPLTFTSARLSQDLDLTREELFNMPHISQAQWVKRYVNAVAAYGCAYIFGGSEEYPQMRLQHEIDRFVNKIFATPGYERLPGNPCLLD